MASESSGRAPSRPLAAEWRWWVLAGLLFLLLGVVTTVAVSWGLRVWHVSRQPPGQYTESFLLKTGDDRWSVSRLRLFGRESFGVVGPLPPEIVSPQRWAPLTDYSVATVPNEPAWAAIERQEHQSTWSLAVGAYGWPLVCLRHRLEMRQSTGGVPVPSGSIALPDWKGTPSGIRLPIVPIWSGLIADSAVYGIGWAAIILGLRALIRLNRMKQGCCRKCGYELRGLGAGADGRVLCPECGDEQGDREGSSSLDAGPVH